MKAPSFDAWDQLGIVAVLILLVAVVAALVLIAIRETTKPRNRYRDDVLPAPQRGAISPRHFADT